MDPILVDNPGRSRFELRAGDELLGWTDYLPAGDSVILAHTEVVDGHEGQGFGGMLVRLALEAIAADGKTVIPTCPFAAGYIRDNPELTRFVVPSLRGL